MKEWLETVSKYGVCFMMNAMFLYFIVKGIAYPDLFTAGLTASWVVLGISAYGQVEKVRYGRHENGNTNTE